MRIYTVLHGGLGNQIFQIFKALLESNLYNNATIILYERTLNNYVIKRENELNQIINSNRKINIKIFKHGVTLLNIRLPKILNKIFGHEILINIPIFGLVIDGYFQNVKYYRKYGSNILAETLEEIRGSYESEFKKVNNSRRLCHVRLKDFFDNRSTAENAALEILKSVAYEADVISDDEEIIEYILRKFNMKNKFKIVPTENLDSNAVLKLMMNYRYIYTNGSSLAFWAAVIAGADLKSSNVAHQFLFEEFMTLKINE